MDTLGSLIIGVPVLCGIGMAFYAAFRRAPVLTIVVIVGAVLALRAVL